MVGEGVESSTDPADGRKRVSRGAQAQQMVERGFRGEHKPSRWWEGVEGSTVLADSGKWVKRAA